MPFLWRNRRAAVDQSSYFAEKRNWLQNFNTQIPFVASPGKNHPLYPLG